jgi:CheY-like chemotaxis protein
LQWLNGVLHEIDLMLGSLSDLRDYPGLLDREDPHLQAYIEHVIHTVRDARKLSGKALEHVGDAVETEAEASRQRTREEAEAADPTPPPPTPVVVRPPVNIERITMANPTGMREIVLVVDADPVTLTQVEEMLTEEDYRVLSVRDSFEAITIYTRLWAGIDLVILDFDMPGMSGDLVFEEMLVVNPQVKAVVSGGLAHLPKLNGMLSRGLKGFLPKPFNRERLMGQIQQILAHRPPASRS